MSESFYATMQISLISISKYNTLLASNIQ